MSEKKIKFNIIDAVIIIVVLAALAFAGYKILSASYEINAEKDTVTYKVSYFCEEVPDFAAYAVEVGAPVTDELAKDDLGIVTNVKIGPSKSHTTDAEGNIHLVTKPNFQALEIETEVEVPAKDADFKFGMLINESKYGIGHTFTFRVGKTKLYGRISGIDKK